MTKLYSLFSILVISISVSTAAACLGQGMETRTFLETLPATAMSKAVVAKVQIASSKIEDIPVNLGKISKLIAEVKVIDAIKGTQKNSKIKVEVAIHSCSHEPKIAAGQTYFLAGSMGTDGIFHGEWKNFELELK